MKRIKLRKKINKLSVFLISIFLIMIGISLIFKYVNKKISPIIMDYASLEAKKLSSIIINKAISKHITEKINTSELFEITKDGNGEIRSIDYNGAIINKFLTETTNSVQINLQNIERGEVDGIEFSDAIEVDYDRGKLEKGIIYEVSSGVIMGNPMLANVGPKVPVKISLVGDAISNVTTNIKNYGINNALIEVNVNIKLNEKVILPFYSELITVQTKVPIAIKIVTGSVPKYYGGTLSKTSPSVVLPNDELK